MSNISIKSRVLPYAYEELSYIQSSGTQYIDTGIIPTQDTRTKAKLYTTQTGNKNWFGGTVSSGCSYCYNIIDYGKIEWKFGSSAWNTTATPAGTSVLNTIYEVDFNRDSKIYIDNQEVVDLSSHSFTVTGNLTMTLFARNGGSARIDGKMYYCKIWDNNTLVRNFIPARKKSTNEVGMYDTVSCTFFTNAGTGSFTAGEVILTVSEISLQHLPTGYTKLDYIQSNGTSTASGQYIDTGYKPTSDTKVECKANWTYIAGGSSWNPTLYGVRSNSSSMYEVLQGGSVIYYQYGSQSPNIPMSTYFGTDSIYRTDGNKFYINNELKITATTSTFTETQNLTLFALNNQGSIQRFTTAKMYYCKIWDNDILVRDFIPAKRNSDNEIGMYDLVTRTFYENVGIGAFTAGNETSNPNDIQQLSINNNIVWTKALEIPNIYTQKSYLQSTGTQYIDTGITTPTGVTVTRWEGETGYVGGSSGRRFIASYDNANISHYSEFNADNKYGCYEAYNSVDISADILYDCSMQVNGSTNTVFTINVGGIEYSTTSTTCQSTTMGNFILFRLTSTYTGSGQIIGRNKVYIDNVLVRDFIPAVRNSDSVAGMYDQVTDTFYENAGTGTFISG